MILLVGAPADNRRRGFSLIELMVAMVIGMIVLTGVVQMLIVQGRGYRKQREMIDVRETARDASTLISWDLRQSAAGNSALETLTSSSVVLRSPRGVGTVCAKHPTLPRYALWKTGGKIAATADDSALVYQIGRGSWNAVKISAVGTPAAMGITACAWPGARAPDIVVELAVSSRADTAYIKVGAPFRSFRKVQYAEFQLNNRWWLGRKVGTAASYEQLTGPLLAPAANGLTFAYYDTLGAVTTNPSAVGTVSFTLRTESYKTATVGQTTGYQHDSVTTKVALRR
jgi:prepilin-type N-terminal cleavage/methylation domain-containing protein